MESQKRNLSENDLYQLRAFIARKGFGEPAVMLEILDHFACKVEELGTQHSSWPLERLMEEAHRQFGVAGFYPLVKSYEEQLARYYRHYFRKSLVGVFKNAKDFGLVILTPLLFYTLSLWTVPIWHSLTGTHSNSLTAWIAFGVFVVIDIAQIRRFPRRGNVFGRAAQHSWYGSLFLPSLYFIYIPLSERVPLLILLVMSAAYVVLQQARYATFRQARQDYEEKTAGFKIAE